jgi:ketosteroid isomerase-like protein
MTVSLPTIISEYLTASDRGDVDAVVACFTSDATVVDEDQEWREGQALPYDSSSTGSRRSPSITRPTSRRLYPTRSNSSRTPRPA